MVRPASRVSPAEGVLKQEISFPPPSPVETRDQEEPLSFWEAVAQVPLDQWGSDGEKGYKIYLFEGYGLKGPYLAKIMDPIDIEWVKQNFGGGDYSATLNNPVGKIESSIRFSVYGEKRSKPVQSVQNAPAVSHPTDGFQSQVLQILREGQERQERLLAQVLERDRNPAPAPSAIDPNVALKGVVDMFSGLLAKATAPQPQMGLLEIVALIEKFKGPDILTLLTQAKTAGLIPASAGSGGDLLAQITQLKEAADLLGITGGKGKTLGEAIIEKLPDLVEAGGNALDKLHTIEQTKLATAREVRAIQQQRATAVITPQPQPAAGQIQPPNSTPQQYTVQPAPGHATGTGLEVESPSAAAAIDSDERQRAFIAGKIVEMIANDDSGAEIIDFLDKIDKRICDSFAGASVEQIMTHFANDAVLKKATTLPRFKAAITEIVQELNAPEEDLEIPPKVVN